jgi:hypothetical protein
LDKPKRAVVFAQIDFEFANGENRMNVSELKSKKINELTQLAKQLKIDGYAGMRKQELIFSLLQAQI